MDFLVEKLKAGGTLYSTNIIKAFRTIDRKDFVLPDYQDEAYEDYPLPIGYAQTISQPTTVALMLEFLKPKAGQKILDVGSGSGWTTALLAHIVGEKGTVYGTEIIPGLVSFGQKNLEKYGFTQASIQPAEKSVGLPNKGPFNRILVSAAAQSVPQELLEQLKPGGILIIPVKNDVLKIRKEKSGKNSTEIHPGFAFVPLMS